MCTFMVRINAVFSNRLGGQARGARLSGAAIIERRQGFVRLYRPASNAAGLSCVFMTLR